MKPHYSPILYVSVSIALLALVMPLAQGGPAVMGAPMPAIAAFVLMLAGLMSMWLPAWQLILTGIAAHGAAFLLVAMLPGVAGKAGFGYWVLVASAWLTALVFIQSLAELKGRRPGESRLIKIAVPALFGLWILILWEILARGFAGPPVQLPAPSQIWGRGASTGTEG